MKKKILERSSVSWYIFRDALYRGKVYLGAVFSSAFQYSVVYHCAPSDFRCTMQYSL